MRRISPLLVPLLMAGCAAEPTALDLAAEETGVDGPFDVTPDEEKADRASSPGPRVAAGAATEVWPAENAWADTTTAAARRAGVAWPADSGLSWEQKYDLWIADFERTPSQTRSGDTFKIPTPYGERVLDAPTLECAEVAMQLRATFASWYHLPFFLQGWDADSRQSIFAGHFGFVNRDGQSVGRFPSFRTTYRDYTAQWRTGQAWPSDARLRGMRLGNDDGVPFLTVPGGGEAGAGAYFDELFLNKRVGYFLRLLLLYFGSANLADGANMFHVRPEAVAPGDALLERWQRRGIGHTIPVMRVEQPVEGRYSVQVATGSMPRRQPVWEEGASAMQYFTNENTGGEGEAYDGTPYVQLGGGLRRWRTATLQGGRWHNAVIDADADAFIDDTDQAAIAARPERFRQILAEVPPEQQRDTALEQIASAREHLRQYPASCAARTRREEAFDRLYTVLEQHFSMGRAQADARYRVIDDYVFGELEYTAARTCCWNSSTAAMAEIILDYARVEQESAAASGTCAAPTVFRSEREGYDRWKRHAESLGRAADWRAWSEDEACSARAVPEDALGRHTGTPWCSRPEPGTEPPATECDPAGGNEGSATATPLTGALEGRICAGDEDWYRVDASGAARVRVAFHHADGDLDVEALSADGSQLASSQGTGDEEVVEASGTFFVRVYGYAGATNGYTITLE